MNEIVISGSFFHVALVPTMFKIVNYYSGSLHFFLVTLYNTLCVNRYYLERSQSIAFIGGHSTVLKSLSLQIFVLRQFSRKISLQWLVTFASTVEGDMEDIINNVQQNSPEAENKRHFFMGTDICSEEKTKWKKKNVIMLFLSPRLPFSRGFSKIRN